MRYFFFIPIIFLLLSACSTGKLESRDTQHNVSSSDDFIDLKVRKEVLENGLTVLIYENHKLPIFTYYTFFDVGGRHESKGTTGATHFLEHMMFKGTEKFGPQVFDKAIESHGGSTNAYTTFDRTVYYESLPSSMLDDIIEMEADRMVGPLLLPDSFEAERSVIFNERKMRYENSPRGQLYLKTMQEVFKGTPYGGSVIGDEKDLKALSREQVKDFFEKFYTPDNAIIVVAGDVDSDDVISQIKDHYGDLKPSSHEIKEYKKEIDTKENFAHQSSYKREVRLHGSSPDPIFMIAYPGERIGTRRGFVMDLLSSILGDGDSSYLSQKYVKGRNPVLSEVGVANYTLQYNGVFWISGKLLDKKSLHSFKKSFLKETKRVCDKAITQRSLQKTLNQYLVDYISGITTNAGVAHFLGLRESFFGDYNFYKKEMEIYRSITVDELKSTCSEIFDENNYIMVSVWNKHPKK